MTKVKEEKSFTVFTDFWRNTKLFSMNLLSHGFLNTDEARPAKVFPTFE